MKVVHIFKDFFPPTTGGIEQHLHLLSTTQAREADVTVLVPGRTTVTTEERVGGVRVIRAAEFGRYASAPLCPTMPIWLRRLRPDIVHVHFPNPMGDLTYLVSGWRGPLVVTYHADIIRQKRLLPFYRPVIRTFLNRAHRILATSADYIESSEWLSAYRDKCVVVPLGIDTAKVRAREEDTQAVCDVRREYGDRIVLFVGVLRYYKGLDVLLRAMVDVDGHAVIVGRGEERQELAASADRLGIAGRVTFAGEVSDERLRLLTAASDVFVLPSIDRCEAFGLSQVEAMACGKPVVATNLPTGVRFVNQHEVTGLLVEPGDATALASALTRLLDNPELRSRLGSAARHRVESEFTADRMVARTFDVYRDVLQQASIRN